MAQNFYNLRFVNPFTGEEPQPFHGQTYTTDFNSNNVYGYGTGVGSFDGGERNSGMAFDFIGSTETILSLGLNGTLTNAEFFLSCGRYRPQPSDSSRVAIGVFARSTTQNTNKSPSNGYFVGFSPNGVNQRRLTLANLASISSPIASPNELTSPDTEQRWYEDLSLRVKLQGNRIRARGWRFDENEPSSWTINETNSAYSAAGACGIYLRSTGGFYGLHGFGVGTDGDSAPITATATGTVSGRLFNPYGQASYVFPRFEADFTRRDDSQVVMALHRESGVPIDFGSINNAGNFSETNPSNTDETTFSISTHDTSMVTVVCLSEQGWAGGIADLITPTTV